MSKGTTVAEQSKSGFNKGFAGGVLVGAALTLGLMTIRGWWVESEARAKVIEVYAWNRDVKKGEVVSVKDVVGVTVPRHLAAFSSVPHRGQEGVLVDCVANRDLLQGDIVRFSDFLPDERRMLLSSPPGRSNRASQPADAPTSRGAEEN